MTDAHANDPIIEVQALAGGYGADMIFEDVTFDVRRREVFAILGPSGCGKSTLMKHIIGLIKPRRGRVLIAGMDIADAGHHQDVLRSFGVMYQHGALFGSMTLLDNIDVVLREFTTLGREARDAIGFMRLHQVGLAAAAYKMPSEISGGMRKRAAIARALALSPQVLFLDEPSAGLDPVTSVQMDELIVRLAAAGMTCVVVTHELESIRSIVGRCVMLDNEARTIVAEGHPDVLAGHEDARVRRFFNPKAPNDQAVALTEFLQDGA